MIRQIALATVALLLAFTGPRTSASVAAEPEWTGAGGVRLIVEVPPVELKDRKADDLVASYAVDFAKLLREHGVEGTVDLSTLQVHQLDPATGKATEFPASFSTARSPFDRPVRFDDDALPESWPASVVRAAQTKDGRSEPVIRQRKARLFNREVRPTTGKLVWVHTQRGDEPSRYAVYFDVRPDAPEWQVSPAPWIGDADVLRRAEGESLGGFAHFTATAADYDGDGLFDLIAGTEKGDVMWFPNHGTRGKPKFIGCRILTDEKGPIDTGWYGAPFLFDWDNDGLKDLLVGTSGNVILWWKNVGTKTVPKLSFRSFVRAGGQRLEVPETPVPEGPAVFKRDYYNQPWVGDFTGDGLPDVVTGGYTTGRIFLFRGTGREPDDTPKLELVGPLEADGRPIDTTWAAAPSCGDFDGDGRLELVTGSWWWSGIRRKPNPGEIAYQMYYRNVGSTSEPKLTRADLPTDGALPDGSISRPSVVDWNDDGLLDLMISASSGDVCVWLNVGSKTSPKWKVSEEPLTIPWGFTEGVDVTAPSADLTGDGRPEFLIGLTFMSAGGSPYSPEVKRVGQATADGKPIEHPGPGYGDPYRFTTLHDWDRDGRVDLLWGTQQGEIFLHRGKGGESPFDFAAGEQVKLASGQPLKVGPPVVASAEEAKDFTVLQGSRVVFAATDFDADGVDDLVVTETFGNVWLFRNTTVGGVDTLAEPVLLHKLPSRTGALITVDWNRDGKPDLMTSGTAAEPGLLFLNESADGKPALAKPSRPFNLPYLFWGPGFGASDWNADGDRDLLVNSEFFTFFIEDSFLTHGYRAAKLIDVSRRDGK